MSIVKKGIRELSLHLEPRAAKTSGASGPPDRTAAWVALGVGGGLTLASLTTAVVFTARGKSAQSDVDSLRRALADEAPNTCADPGRDVRGTCDALSEAASDRNRANRIATVSFVAASALGALTAVATFVLWPRSSVEPDEARGRGMQVGLHESGRGFVFSADF